jgi:hypothetical protein
MCDSQSEAFRRLLNEMIVGAGVDARLCWIFLDFDLNFSWWDMQKDRKRIERQLEQAKQTLATHEKQLEAQGVTGKQKSKDPKWRHLNADARQLKRRLLAVVAIEAREAAAIQRKAEKLNPEVVEA